MLSTSGYPNVYGLFSPVVPLIAFRPAYRHADMRVIAHFLPVCFTKIKCKQKFAFYFLIVLADIHSRNRAVGHSGRQLTYALFPAIPGGIYPRQDASVFSQHAHVFIGYKEAVFT